MPIMYEKYKYLGLGTALNKVRNFDKDRLIVYIDMQGRVATKNLRRFSERLIKESIIKGEG